MARKRKDFTEKQRAEIYVRDRATCCFSGANLWLLDAPLRPGYECDWADHVLPSAKGGISDPSNGVCAGHTFNSKKRHNSADNSYLFERGIPTAEYFHIFGPLPLQQQQRLKRLSKLSFEDWFFNRAIINTFLAFDERCGREFYGNAYKRNDCYWLRAAYRFLRDYQKIPKTASLEKRKIVTKPCAIKKQWLEIRETTTEKEFLEIVHELFPTYRRNYQDWANYFWDCETFEDFSSAYRKSNDSKTICSTVLSCIESHFRLLEIDQNRLS